MHTNCTFNSCDKGFVDAKQVNDFNSNTLIDVRPFFEGQIKNSLNKLNWETHELINNDLIELERVFEWISIGKNWKLIATRFCNSACKGTD